MPFGKQICAFARIVALLLAGGALWAQGSTNPFDIVREPEAEALVVVPVTGNPFDIIPRAGSTQPLAIAAPAPAPAEKVTEKLTTSASRDDFRQFIFFLLLDGFVLFTILFLMFGSWLGKAWQGVRNPQLLHLLYREWNGRVRLPMWVWYVFFAYGLSSLIFLVTLSWGWLPADRPPWQLWGLMFGGVALWLLARHLVLWLVRVVFQSEALRYYNFTIATFHSLLGVVLLPLAAVWAYGPEAWHGWLFWATAGSMLGVYMYRTMSVLLQRGQAVLQSPFLFLLYICAVELAPVVVAVRALQHIASP